jgi:enoyl-CoA hydratase/carnithine racemase
MVPIGSNASELSPPIIVRQGSDGIATLVLNRPQARNALNRPLLTALHEAVDRLAGDQAIHCLVLAGAGRDAFSAGADLRERLALSPAERTAHTAAINASADAIAGFPVPVIAALRGFALAGGAELALACDLRIAADPSIGGPSEPGLLEQHPSFVIGFPEVAIGIFPGAGAPVRLPRLVGPAIARDLLFTGRRVDAREALRIGLINELVAPGQLDARVLAIARDIAAKAPLAIRALKRSLVESEGLTPAQAHQVVGKYRAPLDGTLDYTEGLAAFAERRAPIFRAE